MNISKWDCVLPSGAQSMSWAKIFLHEPVWRVMRMQFARYAALCQEAGMVPIVEPEVLMDGDIH